MDLQRLSSMELYRPRRRKSHLRPNKPMPVVKREGTQLKCIYEEEINRSSDVFQRISWEILDRSIFILINKIKNAEINDMLQIKNKLIYLNIISGKGLLCRYIIQAQLKSTNYTYKYALFMSLINTEFSEVGMLLLKRCIYIFFCGYYNRTKDKLLCFPILKFIAHLINYNVADPILAVDFVKLLLKAPTEESVKMAYSIIHICGHKMREMYTEEMDEIANNEYNSDQGLDSGIAFKILYTISHVIKTNKYSNVESFDIVTDKKTITHLLTLGCNVDPEEHNDYYVHKPTCEAETYRLYYEQFIQTENNKTVYLLIYDINDGYENYYKNGNKINYDVNNNTENIKFIKEIILDIIMNSSFDYVTSALKLMRIKMKPGQEQELVCMILDLCCEKNIHNDHLGRLGHVTQILCQLNEFLAIQLERKFTDSYLTIHGVEFVKIRNISKYFAHLLFTDTITWDVLSIIQLNKATTNSYSLMFVKFLFCELVDNIGYKRLESRIYSEFNIKAFEGIFLGDGANDFFTSIDLDGLIEVFLHCRSSIKYN